MDNGNLITDFLNFYYPLFMEVFLLCLRILLAAVFAVAAFGKFLDRDGAEKAAAGFGVPGDLKKLFAVALPVGELFIALLLLFVATSWFGAVLAFLLLAVFVGAMIYQMAKGNAPDCHCFGQIYSEPVGKSSLIRNIILLILAILLVVAGSNQGYGLTTLPDEIAAQFVFGAILSALVGAVIYYLKQIVAGQTQIMRRLEIIELTGAAGETKRENVTHPHDGLPIGAPAPDFALPDTNGKIFTFNDLFARRKPLLLFFVSPECNPCRALLPQIEAWQSQLKDELEIIFISSGSAEKNLEKFGGTIAKEILLQTKKETAELFHAPWTPTALLINTDGAIASRPAAGDQKIFELIGKIKAESNLKSPKLLIDNGDRQGRPAMINKSVPSFSLTDLSGEIITEKNLDGKLTLAIFWNPDCPHCHSFIDELREFERTTNGNAPQMFIFADGGRGEYENLDVRTPILLDKDYDTAAKLGMFGTPSAVLIDASGEIVSETAIGAPQIWALIGQ